MRASSNPMKKGRLSKRERDHGWREDGEQSADWLAGGGLRPVCSPYMCESVESVACGFLHCPPACTEQLSPSTLCSQKEPGPKSIM